jgi:SAM-dependent methyltransferase
MKLPHLLGGDEWKAVFQRRNVWELSESILIDWRNQNERFYRWFATYAPPPKQVLELGCGPGRHAIVLSQAGYSVVAVELDSEIATQAQRNVERLAPDCDISIQLGDITRLSEMFEANSFDVVSHGGMLEHYESAGAIRGALEAQLTIAPIVIFDVPLPTPKNLELFRQDNIFRQLWTSREWLDQTLMGFNVLAWAEELHSEMNMTDDLVCVVGREPRL